MASTDKPAPKTPAQERKWEVGTVYKCIVSKSPGYRVGGRYPCYRNRDGHMCLKGEDGFEDITHMLLSGFVPDKSAPEYLAAV